MLTKSKTKLYNFLKWTERWTKTDMVYLAKGGFWLSIGQGVTTASAILLSIAFANLLPIEKYGEYKFILSITPLLVIPTLGGMKIAISRAAAKNFDGVLTSGIKTSMKWGLGGSLLSLGVAIFYYITHNTNLAITFLIISFFIPLTDPLDSFSSFLQGKRNFQLSVKLNIIREVFIASITLASLWLTNNVLILILVYFSSRTIINFFLLQITINQTKKNNENDPESISIGKHYSMMNIISVIGEQADKILVWHYLGATQLAIYSFAMLPGNQLNGLFFKNLSTLAFPKLSEMTAEQVKKTLPPKIHKYMIITIIVSVFYVVLAPIFFKLLFPQYTSAVIYSQFYILSFTLVPFSLYSSALMAQGEIKNQYSMTLVINILKILLFMVLLPLYGVGGGIATYIIIQICIIIYLIKIFKKM